MNKYLITWEEHDTPAQYEMDAPSMFDVMDTVFDYLEEQGATLLDIEEMDVSLSDFAGE
jgi:hypothetical protein